MICSLDELKTKEVIDMKTGGRLGYIDDIRMDTDSSEVISLMIYGGYKFFGLFGREQDTEIPCSSIKVIGSDIILVDGSGLTVCTEYIDKKPRKLFE